MSSLIIAAAGAGKTTFLVKQALKISEKKSIPVWALHCRAGFADI